MIPLLLIAGSIALIGALPSLVYMGMELDDKRNRGRGRNH